MSWWEIALLIYFIPFPIPQIVTFAVIAVACDEFKYRKKGKS